VIALGGANGNLEAIEVADGSTRYEVGLQDRPVAVGGLDAGRVLVGGVGSVWAVDLLDGEVVWKQQYGGETRVNAPGVGDVANDGTPEVVAVNRKGALLGLNRNGEPVLRGGLDGTDGTPVVYAGPLVADTDGDGTDEVVVVDETGRARVLSS
jgi:outer membrane protein assembly factor BamB